jgi:hypothetical protein
VSRDHANEVDYRYNEKKDDDIRGNKKIITFIKSKAWVPKVGL